MTDGPATAPTEWESLQTLRRDEELGPAVKWSFAWLWHFAGCQPGYVVIKARDLGCEFGVSPQAAGKWLKALAENSLIEIIDRDRGRLHIYVFNPNPAKRLPRPDPQRRLFEPSTDANLSQAKGSTPAKGANLSQAKGANLSHAKGSTPCKETPENTGSPPDAPNLSRPKGSPPFIDTKEEENFNLPESQRSVQGFNDIEGPAPVGVAIGEFLDQSIARFEAATKPAEQKQRLKGKIKSLCGVGPAGQRVADWVAGCAADLVIFHGIPDEDLTRIFTDIQAMRAVGSLENGPAFFCAKARQLADRHGLPFGKQKAPQP